MKHLRFFGLVLGLILLGGRPALAVDQMMTGCDVSTTSCTSGAESVAQYNRASVQAVFTGAPVGTLKLQVSNDAITWTDLTGSSTAISAAGNVLFDLWAPSYPLIRAVYTKTSGTGALNMTVNFKDTAR